MLFLGNLPIEDLAPGLRGLEHMRQKEWVQDYVVTPHQLWLDGIAAQQNQVRQFVAMPTDSCYSVEVQVTGRDIFGGLLFEITPPMPQASTSPRHFEIIVITLTDRKIHLLVRPNTTIYEVQRETQEKEGIPPYQQRLLLGDHRLESGKCKSCNFRGTLLSRGQTKNSNIIASKKYLQSVQPLCGL